MDEVRSGRIPFCKLDVLHRQNLERILPRFGVSGLPEDVSTKSQSRLAPARCLAGCAARVCAAQAALLAGAGLERQHFADGRSGTPQRPALGCHPRRPRWRGDYKPKPRVYLAACEAFDLAARRLHDGGRAQQRPRACGRSAGCAPAHIARPNEHGPVPARRRRRCRSMWHRRSLEDLAAKLGA